MRPSPHVLLSRETGQPAFTSDGARAGAVVDLTVRLDEAHPVIHRVGLGSGRRIRHLVPWPLVRRLDEHRLTLALRREGLPAYEVGPDTPLEDGELLLCRDVLDTEVVDLEGQRLSRVSDVLVAHRPDGRIEVAAVDVGLGSLLRRMGLGLLAGRLSPIAVDWANLHLTSGRGHIVQLRTATPGVQRLDADGLADLLSRLSAERAADVMRTVGPARSAVAVDAGHPDLGRRLMRSMTDEEARQVIQAAPADRRSRLEELRRPTPERRRRLLRTAGWRGRRRVRRPTSPRHGRPGSGG